MHNGPDLSEFESRVLADASAPGFECGACTACCTVLAVVALQKPARSACRHVCRSGCRDYERRPLECREFQCVWMRGALGGAAELRPDSLGVMFDCFVEQHSGRTRLIAFELWPGALSSAVVRELLERLCATRRVELSYRNGAWSVLERQLGAEAPGAGASAKLSE